MGQIVIVAYKPKPSKKEALKHLSRLKTEGLATDRESIIMEAVDDTIIEVFEWLSAEAIANAHNKPVVQEAK